MRSQVPDVWVVYQAAPMKGVGQQVAVCTQAEWDEMERDQPGRRTLVRDRILTEPEAERLVRSFLPPAAAKAARKPWRPPLDRPAASPSPAPPAACLELS